jgi:hypothetical protein
VKAGENKDYRLEVGTYLSRPEVLFHVVRRFFMRSFFRVLFRRWKACS